ncbi:excisionase family DNA binding protein [Mesorhizobium soli]|uniref:helix-turn-helix domain-containing protein n=1 Tax=Pseudaminobacter soli (ex Li et al. 2025) TaxID=1295366 RepID=UPI002473D69C|nr:helix-turn-helix domain-containing protein [Mesorhizobium soli]MDH6235157.1 excisionase family DNA binding protein [Mesorhizobium soli]
MTDADDLGPLKENIAATRAYLASLEAQLAAKLNAAVPEPSDDLGPWLTAQRAAGLVGVDESTLRRWARQHKIGRYKGGRHEISKHLLDKLMGWK